jgi:hypothetical protein
MKLESHSSGLESQPNQRPLSKEEREKIRGVLPTRDNFHKVFQPAWEELNKKTLFKDNKELFDRLKNEIDRIVEEADLAETLSVENIESMISLLGIVPQGQDEPSRKIEEIRGEIEELKNNENKSFVEQGERWERALDQWQKNPAEERARRSKFIEAIDLVYNRLNREFLGGVNGEAE